MIAEDSVLLREGITRLLVDAGEEVVAGFGDADALLGRAGRRAPKDCPTSWSSTCACRPPTPTRVSAPRCRSATAGRRSASSCCRSTWRSGTRPSSSPATPSTVVGGVGYLLKDRVADVRDFVDALRRVGDGGTVLDPEVVTQLLARARQQDPLERLTPRERTVLSLMAEGRSNAAIAQALVVSDGAVEKHVSNIFTKLDLPPASEDHRRVLAVLRWLES